MLVIFLQLLPVQLNLANNGGIFYIESQEDGRISYIYNDGIVYARRKCK